MSKFVAEQQQDISQPPKSWAQVAEKMSAELDRLDSRALAESGLQSSSEMLARFAAANSITVNTARRQLLAATFLRKLMEPTAFLSVIEKRCPPFNDVEYLKKIHDIAPDTAAKLLDAVLDRSISRSKLATLYKELQKNVPYQRHRISIRRGSAIDFRSQVIAALGISTFAMYPERPKANVTRMPREFSDFEFALPDAVIEIQEERDIGVDIRIDAVEIRMPNEWAKHEIWQILERIQLMSTFFTQTWLFMPSPNTDEQREFIDKLIRATEKLYLPSVGLVTCAVKPEVNFEVALRPSGLSDIDRRYLFPMGSERERFLEGTPAERAKRIRRDASR